MDSIQPYMLMMMSSFKNDNSNSSSYMQYLYVIILLVPYFSKFFPYINNIVNNYIKTTQNIVSINIQSHEVPVVRSFSSAGYTKLVYSDSFLAVTHYLINNTSNIETLTEVLENNRELNMPSNGDYDINKINSFIYMPLNCKKILVSHKHQIYCELKDIQSKDGDSDSGNSTGDKKDKFIQTKKTNFIITISIDCTYLEDKNSGMTILKEFVDNCVKEYDIASSTKDNTKQYIYEFKNSEKSENNVELFFDEYALENNKDLITNIFFENKQKLINYITPFIYDSTILINPGEEKYKRSGFTFKAGLLFYGSPGCGKTSTIKAILKYTNRHAVIINLNKVKTCEELQYIFRKRKFNKKVLNGKQLCYILEDCDAFDNNIITTRNSSNDEDPKKILENSEMSSITKLMELTTATVKTPSKADDVLNLSCFLNILDGIIELHGIMIIMTTNYPEKIDEALIRPGRFDFKYEFKKASKEIIKDMLQFKFELTKYEIEQYTEHLNIKDEILSPAEVQSICFKNDNIIECIKELVLACQQ